jgi:hypothetical protein
MESLDSAVSNFDASSKVLLKTVTQKLLPSLNATSINWSDVLVITVNLNVMLLLIVFFLRAEQLHNSSKTTG